MLQTPENCRNHGIANESLHLTPGHCSGNAEALQPRRGHRQEHPAVQTWARYPAWARFQVGVRIQYHRPGACPTGRTCWQIRVGTIVGGAGSCAPPPRTVCWSSTSVAAAPPAQRSGTRFGFDRAFRRFDVFPRAIVLYASFRHLRTC